jgi:hypothetical protein
MEESDGKKISEYDFIIRSIKKLRKPPYKGIHSVYSGFNQAFREYYNKDPVEVTTRLAQEGKIATRPVKGGALLYLPEDAPGAGTSKNVLKKILGDNDLGEDSVSSKPKLGEEDENEDEIIILGPEDKITE